LPLHTVADQAMSRVVTIEGARPDDEELGTGWLFDRDGDFVTNAHVIEGQLAVRIRDRSGIGHVGVVMGVDRQQDIAVIRSADGFDRAPLPLAGPGDPTLPLDAVTVASGRATGHGDITLETITALHQDVPVKGNPSVEPGVGTTTTTYHDMMVVQGATIYSGNSGGPLLDGQGQVLGIITLKSKDQSQGYAIPLARVLAEIRSFAERSTPTGQLAATPGCILLAPGRLVASANGSRQLRLEGSSGRQDI
jgi:serine protease Do